MFLHSCCLRTTTSPDGAEEATALPRCDGAAGTAGPTRCREMEKISHEPRCQPDFVSSAYVLPTCWICLVLFTVVEFGLILVGHSLFVYGVLAQLCVYLR